MMIVLASNNLSTLKEKQVLQIKRKKVPGRKIMKVLHRTIRKVQLEERKERERVSNLMKVIALMNMLVMMTLTRIISQLIREIWFS